MNAVPESTFEKSLILYFRLAIGWTFLYVGGSQLLEHFSAAGFLNATRPRPSILFSLGSPRPERLDHLFVEDILATPDEEILAGFKEHHGDITQYAAAMRARFEKGGRLCG
jgi:hypothetical protein